MNHENSNGVPTGIRGLGMLLVDNDTESLLNMASQLEDYSYRVTTTELASVALSILHERRDHFDVVMADINMPEMDLFKFIKNVRLIKDVPIILMSLESNKDLVKEAMVKGACFFLEKPISSKNLKNVWQHVYRYSKYEKSRGGKADTKSNADQEAESSRRPYVQEEDKVTKEGTMQGLNRKEEVGDSDDQVLDILADGNRLAGICRKRCMSTENDGAGESKRKRTKSWTRMTELASSSNSLNQKQFHDYRKRKD